MQIQIQYNSGDDIDKAVGGYDTTKDPFWSKNFILLRTSIKLFEHHLIPEPEESMFFSVAISCIEFGLVIVETT